MSASYETASAHGSEKPPAPPPVNKETIAALAQDPALTEVSWDKQLLCRYVAANGGNVEQARRKLHTRLQRYRYWRSIGLMDVADQEVDALLDGQLAVKGYWQVGGLDNLGRRTCWLFQHKATPAKELHDALVGVKGTHKFFESIASDWKTLSEGMIIVVLMGGVTWWQLTNDIRKNLHTRKVGNYFKEVIPIKFRKLIFVNCVYGLESTVRLLSRFELELDTRGKLEFVPNLAALEKFGLHRSSWPVSLQGGETDAYPADQQPPPPLEATSQWCTARCAEFQKLCDDILKSTSS